MRNRVLALMSVVAMAATALVVGALPSADAQLIDPFEFSVVKVVDGPVPAGTVFEVEVVCIQEGVSDAPSSAGPPVEVTMTFDETGAPLDDNSLPVGPGYTCTATETVDGGAASVAYACSVENPLPPPPSPEGIEFATCISDQAVQFLGIRGTPDPGADTEGDGPLASGEITVTNTFEEEPPPPVEPDEDEPDVVPDVVTATPPFTG